jgi:hypothetical protein
VHRSDNSYRAIIPLFWDYPIYPVEPKWIPAFVPCPGAGQGGVMKKALSAAVVLLLAGAGFALGQSAARADGPPDGAAVDGVFTGHHAGPVDDTLWVSGEYLLWWTKNPSLPPSLITTGPVSDNPGALGHGGVPLTGDTVDYHGFSGFRVTGGLLFDDLGNTGLELSGFFLPRQNQNAFFGSDAKGNPVLAFRYLDPPVNGVAAEDAFQAAVPSVLSAGPPQLGPYHGTVGYAAENWVWGLEANVFAIAVSDGNSRIQLLAGFRYLNMDDNLDLSFSRTNVAGSGSSVEFLGKPFADPGATVSSLDAFNTRNQFYGGQVGARSDFRFGQVALGLTGKIALGDTHEVVNINGTSSVGNLSGPPIATANVGQFAGPSNIGRTANDQFAVVPEAEIKLSYFFCENVRAFVGYNILYWSRVVRAGDQVDLTVDTRGDPIDPGFVAKSTTLFPQSQFNHTDFWAQGIDIGMEFRY